MPGLYFTRTYYPGGAKALWEDLQSATGDHLSTFHSRTGTARPLGDVATDVGVTKEGKDSNLRHCEAIARCQQTDYMGEDETEVVKRQQQVFFVG